MNSDFRVSVDFFAHHKTKKLRRRLGYEGVVALLQLWAYAAPLPRHRWQIILPGTGEVLVLTEDEFSETWVLESECPPAVRKLFDGFESYARWRLGR